MADRPRERLITSRHDAREAVEAPSGSIRKLRSGCSRPLLRTKAQGLAICRSIIEAHSGRVVGPLKSLGYRLSLHSIS